MIVGIIVALFFLGIAFVLSHLLRHAVQRAGRRDLSRVLGSIAFWSVVFFGFLVVMTIVLPNIRAVDIFTSLGIGSVALGFAFKDILQNWLAGVFILIRRPFHRGDQIKVGDIEGTVQAVETRATLVKTYGGKLVIIPNADIYTQAVTVNTAYPMRRVEISVPLGMGSDLRNVIRIFSEAVKEVDHVLTEPPVDVLPWELCEQQCARPRARWTRSQRSYEVRTRAAVVAAIHRVAAEHGIDIPPDDTISFADTPLYVVETKAPRKPRRQTKPLAAAASDPNASGINPRCLDEPQDPEAERPRSGELNKGLEDVPR